MAEDSGEDKERSKYNEALLQIQRLHELWLKISRVRESGHYNSKTWLHYLDEIWGELIADVERRADKNKIKVENTTSKLKIKKAETEFDNYYALCERQEFLKILQDKVGKGGRYEDGTEGQFE